MGEDKLVALLQESLATAHAINTVLAAAGYNFRRLLVWLARLLSAIWIALAALGRSQTLPAAG